MHLQLLFLTLSHNDSNNDVDDDSDSAVQCQVELIGCVAG